MVSRFSRAALLLALGTATTAFVPTKLSSVPRTSSSSNGEIVANKLEGCDAVLKRMEGKISSLEEEWQD
eukprot:scaffold45734_cov24-Cyclotella_meneghiniana.AAC.2